jgi:hypothetical protein
MFGFRLCWYSSNLQGKHKFDCKQVELVGGLGGTVLSTELCSPACKMAGVSFLRVNRDLRKLKAAGMCVTPSFLQLVLFLEKNIAL